MLFLPSRRINMDQRTNIPWHPAFITALKLELDSYKDKLEFITEYQLTAEPLRIDVVIIKKSPEIVIERNIARIFKEVNILEYKSPGVSFSIYDFYKVLSYTYLYAALNKILVNNMTVTITETHSPRELFKYFEEKKNTVEKTSQGIYSVRGYSFDIQIIVSKELPAAENLWLKGLTNDLNTELAGVILKESHKISEKREIGAYLYALICANLETVREVLKMSDERMAFDRLMEELGLTAKWEKTGEARGEIRGEARGEIRGEAKGEKKGLKKAVELLKQGYTVEQLEQMTLS
jgi:hypothetical protein